MQECRLKKKKKKIKCKIFLGINPIPSVMTYSTALRFLEEGLWWYKSDLLAAAPQAWSGFTWHQRGLSSSVHPFLRATSPGQTRFILLSCGLSMFVWWTDWLRLKKKKNKEKKIWLRQIRLSSTLCNVALWKDRSDKPTSAEPIWHTHLFWTRWYANQKLF